MVCRPVSLLFLAVCQFMADSYSLLVHHYLLHLILHDNQWITFNHGLGCRWTSLADMSAMVGVVVPGSLVPHWLVADRLLWSWLCRLGCTRQLGLKLSQFHWTDDWVASWSCRRAKRGRADQPAGSRNCLTTEQLSLTTKEGAGRQGTFKVFFFKLKEYN